MENEDLIDASSLLVDTGQPLHSGDGTIFFSFLGTNLPGYVQFEDQDNDGTNDFADVLADGPGANDDFNVALSDGAVPDLGFTVEQRAGIQAAIEAWNEVAHVNLQPGASPRQGSGTSEIEDVPVGFNMVGGLGGPAGLGETTLARNDDGSASIDLSPVFEGGLNFFGNTHTTAFVNTNGSISFENAISTFTPTTITGGTTPIIAPFWADVDTSHDNDEDTPDSGPIYVDIDPVRDVVTITWLNVGFYDQNAQLRNSFQLQLYDRGSGDFDIVFRYDDINWTSGDASNGIDGLNGVVARMGYSAGNGSDFFELPQAGNQPVVLALENTSGNTGESGLWLFPVRGGQVFGDITIGQTSFEGQNFFGFATTFSEDDRQGITSNGDIWLNTKGETLDFSAGGNAYLTALHEFGHVLGLSHPNGREIFPEANNRFNFTVMSYEPFLDGDGSPVEARPITPQVLDIEAIQSIYGANTDTRNGDTAYFGSGDVYALDANGNLEGTQTAAIVTVWDGGGTDVVDFSAQSGFNVINLEPSGKSSAGGLDNAITMSAAVAVDGKIVNLIENAIGGTGTDFIFGNVGDNQITGNGGNDEIDGMDGRDTAIFSGNQISYTLQISQNDAVVIDRRSDADGEDKLTSIELLDFDGELAGFDDQPMDLDRFDDATLLSSAQLREIIELYVAYFDRAPDALGVGFWAASFARSEITMGQMAELFFDQGETRLAYADVLDTSGRAITDTTEFVTRIFDNVLGRTIDDAGRDFWVGVIENGDISAGAAISAIIAGAKAPAPPGSSPAFVALQAADTANLNDKTDIGIHFAVIRGMSDVNDAEAAMDIYDGSASSKLAARASSEAAYQAALDPENGEFLLQLVGVTSDPFAGGF